MKKFLNKKIAALIFAIPLFFLPNTVHQFGMDNFSKTFLLTCFTSISLILFLYSKIKSKDYKFKLSFQKTLIAYFAVGALSAYFGAERYSSFWGSSEVISFSLAQVFIYGALHLTLVNVLNLKSIKSNLQLLSKSYSICLLLSLIFLLGVGGEYLQSQARLILGSPEDFTILAAIFATFFLFDSFQSSNSLFTRKISGSIFFFSLCALLLYNFAYAWLIFAFGLISVLYFTTKKENNPKNKKITILSLLLLFSSFFIYYDFFVLDNKAITNRLATNLQLDLPATAKITKQSIFNSPLLGFGPGNFSYAASLFRDSTLNTTELWHLRFNKSSSFILEQFVTLGVVGAVIYLFFIVLVLFKIHKSNSKDKYLLNSVSLVLVLLIFTQFIYSPNTILLFLFWIFLSFFIVINSELSSKKPILANIKSFFYKLTKYFINYKTFHIFLSIIIFLVSLFLVRYTKIWIAEMIYNNSQQNKITLNKVISLNPTNYKYHLSLSRAYIEEGITEVDKKGAQKDMAKIGDLINKSVISANRATNLAPNSVISYKALGEIYRKININAEGAHDLTIKAFKKASSLEPSNPAMLMDLGKAQLSADKNLKARDSFAEALKQKPNLTEAVIYLSRTYSSIGDFGMAKIIIDKIDENKREVELEYELAQIYFNAEKYEQAITQFEKILPTYPDNSIILYQLALSYEKSGNKDLALNYYNKTLALNPENTKIQEIITKLK